MKKVVEKNNPNAVHCYTWSKDGDSGMFTDKTLGKDSFVVDTRD